MPFSPTGKSAWKPLSSSSRIFNDNVPRLIVPPAYEMKGWFVRCKANPLKLNARVKRRYENNVTATRNASSAVNGAVTALGLVRRGIRMKTM